jgi:hypothetical protein
MFALSVLLCDYPTVYTGESFVQKDQGITQETHRFVAESYAGEFTCLHGICSFLYVG